MELTHTQLYSKYAILVQLFIWQKSRWDFDSLKGKPMRFL